MQHIPKGDDVKQLILSEDEVTNLRIDEAKAPAPDANLYDIIECLNAEDAYAVGKDHGRAEVISWMFEKLEGE